MYIYNSQSNILEVFFKTYTIKHILFICTIFIVENLSLGLITKDLPNDRSRYKGIKHLDENKKDNLLNPRLVN